MEVKRFNSIQEAFDDLFDLPSENDYHDSIMKKPLEQMLAALQALINRINAYPFHPLSWARYKFSCYEGYGWNENPFITNIFIWTFKVVDGIGTPQMDLNWKVLTDQMTCYVIYLALQNKLPFPCDDETSIS